MKKGRRRRIPELGIRYQRSGKEILLSAQDFERLVASATTDLLTGLSNRIQINHYLENTQGYTLALIDVDFFKNINDSFGHDTGDEVLKSLADILRHHSGRNAKIGRWGGEEFIVIFQDERYSPVKLAENIRRAVEEKKFIDRETGNEINLTVSIGLAQWRQGEVPHQTQKRADQALYKAKENGRNKVVIAD